MFDLIGGYLDADTDRVAQIAGQARPTGTVGDVLTEALRFNAFLTLHARATGYPPVRRRGPHHGPDRLGATPPPHHELAVATALDHFLAGRAADAVAAFGDGPEGDLIALHTLAAYTAVPGTHLFEPGEFTSTNLAVLGSLMYQHG